MATLSGGEEEDEKVGERDGSQTLEEAGVDAENAEAVESDYWAAFDSHPDCDSSPTENNGKQSAHDVKNSLYKSLQGEKTNEQEPHYEDMASEPHSVRSMSPEVESSALRRLSKQRRVVDSEDEEEGAGRRKAVSSEGFNGGGEPSFVSSTRRRDWAGGRLVSNEVGHQGSVSSLDKQTPTIDHEVRVPSSSKAAGKSRSVPKTGAKNVVVREKMEKEKTEKEKSEKEKTEKVVPAKRKVTKISEDRVNKFKMLKALKK